MALRAARCFPVLLIIFIAWTGLARAEEARRIVTTENQDYFGFDLRSEQNVSLDQCKIACLGDPACRAFTYNNKAKWCFLKSDYNTLKPFAGATAGKVVLYTVLFDVDNTDGALMPQMSAQVFFVQAAATHVLVVPLTALQPIDGKPDRYTARVSVDGRIETRQVQTGVHDRLHAEVLSGLKAGDMLVTAIHRERAGAGGFRW